MQYDFFRKHLELSYLTMMFNDFATMNDKQRA